MAVKDDAEILAELTKADTAITEREQRDADAETASGRILDRVEQLVTPAILEGVFPDAGRGYSQEVADEAIGAAVVFLRRAAKRAWARRIGSGG